MDADPKLIRVRIVPVEVFGTDDCCEHNPDGVGERCAAAGYGLMDAVSCWSDCNRAVGHIYRFDDLLANREPGETLTVWVDHDEYVAFVLRRFGTPDD